MNSSTTTSSSRHPRSKSTAISSIRPKHLRSNSVCALIPPKSQSSSTPLAVTKPRKDPKQECVDYLSYEWDDLDLHRSWRVMTKAAKAQSFMNGRR